MMKTRAGLMGVVVAVTASAWGGAAAEGTLIISEVLANEVGSDTTGEWIEIYNNGATTIDLTNFKVGDEETSGATSTTESIYMFPSGASIAPGEVQIVAISATRFNTVYGFMPTYETAGAEAGVPDLTVYSTWDPDGGQINMGNSNDQAFILDASDVLVDAVNWGNNFFLNPGIDVTTAPLDGQSFERIDPNTDTDTREDWRFGPAGATAAERSTPGVIPEPTALSLLAIGSLGLLRRRVRGEFAC